MLALGPGHNSRRSVELKRDAGLERDRTGSRHQGLEVPLAGGADGCWPQCFGAADDVGAGRGARWPDEDLEFHGSLHGGVPGRLGHLTGEDHAPDLAVSHGAEQVADGVCVLLQDRAAEPARPKQNDPLAGYVGVRHAVQDAEAAHARLLAGGGTTGGTLLIYGP